MLRERFLPQDGAVREATRGRALEHLKLAICGARRRGLLTNPVCGDVRDTDAFQTSVSNATRHQTDTPAA